MVGKPFIKDAKISLKLNFLCRRTIIATFKCNRLNFMHYLHQIKAERFEFHLHRTKKATDNKRVALLWR
ncbi:hypothetical protein B4903_12990 [Yersinia frederiksenii]|nr:hypothetical protein B4903_12990 [Yersinia frederiksenii]